VLRLVLAPLAALLFAVNASANLTTFFVIIALALCYVISAGVMYLFSKKFLPFTIKFNKKLVDSERKKINSFLKGASFTVLSGMFLGYIDVIMLGRYVSSETIGFYQAAFSLVGALVYLIPFSISFFPLFSTANPTQLKNYLEKSLRATLVFSFLLLFITFIFSGAIIKIIFGQSYESSSILLRILSILIVLIPLSNVYMNFLFVKNKSVFIAKSLILTTLLNVVLNGILIKILLPQSELLAAAGVAVATIVSRAILVLIFYLKK
jgi:PST family polysaccharide transporter